MSQDQQFIFIMLLAIVLVSCFATREGFDNFANNKHFDNMTLNRAGNQNSLYTNVAPINMNTNCSNFDNKSNCNLSAIILFNIDREHNTFLKRHVQLYQHPDVTTLNDLKVDPLFGANVTFGGKNHDIVTSSPLNGEISLWYF